MLSPKADEVLFTYIAVAPHAMSLVLIRVDSGKQRPVYYMSKSLHETEIRCLPLEKAILAVVHCTRKLPHYFQAHKVVVLTQLPLKAILRSVDYTGRIAKWGTILNAFDIKYMTRTSVKGQVLADLIAEFTEASVENELNEHRMDEKSVGLIAVQESLQWKVYVDGAANQKGSDVGLVLITLEELVVEKSLRLDFSATNNEAEYETMLEGMPMIHRIGGKSVTMFSNSRLVISQVKGELEAKDDKMRGYLTQVKYLQKNFESFNLQHIPRSGNTYADSLATLAISSAQFLSKDILPEDKSEAEKIRQKAPQFWLSEDQKLYKRSFSRPYLLCIHPKASELLLEELHEGICGSHIRGRSLAHRAITQSYWWPNMQKEALEYTKKCDQCQTFAPNTHQPRGFLNPLSSPWPFAQWAWILLALFLKKRETRNICWST